MGRLIDADAMLNEVSLESIFIPCGKESTELALRQWINKQPTAYDVEKVAEVLVDTFGDDICELDGNYECYTDIPCDECKRNRMLDLVRKGGVE